MFNFFTIMWWIVFMIMFMSWLNTGNGGMVVFTWVFSGAVTWAAVLQSRYG